MPKILLTYTCTSEFRVNLPPETGNKNADAATFRNALQEAVGHLANTNLYTIDPESIRFSVEED